MNIPKNRAVKNKGNVQNIIASAILRQKGDFTKANITEKIESDIKFSCFGKYGKNRHQINLTEMIDNTFDSMWSLDLIRFDTEKETYRLNMCFPSLH